MNLPRKKLTIEQFNTAIDKGFEARYNVNPITKEVSCKKCGGPVVSIDCVIATHFGDECVDEKTEFFLIPTCMHCEGLPSRTVTCVHIKK